MKYRVCRKADGFIMARGLTMRQAMECKLELTVTMRRKYVIRADTGPVERLNVER